MNRRNILKLASTALLPIPQLVASDTPIANDSIVLVKGAWRSPSSKPLESRVHRFMYQVAKVYGDLEPGHIGLIVGGHLAGHHSLLAALRARDPNPNNHYQFIQRTEPIFNELIWIHLVAQMHRDDNTCGWYAMHSPLTATQHNVSKIIELENVPDYLKATISKDRYDNAWRSMSTYKKRGALC